MHVQVVSTVKQMSPGQRAGHIAMNHTREAIETGMHEALRLQVGHTFTHVCTHTYVGLPHTHTRARASGGLASVHRR